MELFILDKDGTQYIFNNHNFLEYNKNKKSLYSVKLNTSEGDFFRTVNAIAIIKQKKEVNIDNKNKLEIKFINSNSSIFLPYNDITLKFKEEKHLYCDIDTYDISYFFKGLNYVSINDKSEKKPIYETGYFVFSDGTLLTINDIVSYENFSNNKNSYNSYIVNSKQKKYVISNCIFTCFYKQPKQLNNSILNLMIADNHIKIKGIKRTDIEFYFIENKEKITYEKNNKDLKFELLYFYKYFSAVWYSQSDNSIVNIQNNFKKNRKSNILSL